MLTRYLKAVVAAVISGLTAAQVALDAGPVSMTQWVTLGIGTLVAILGVWAVPNSAPAPPAAPPAV